MIGLWNYVHGRVFKNVCTISQLLIKYVVYYWAVSVGAVCTPSPPIEMEGGDAVAVAGMLATATKLNPPVCSVTVAGVQCVDCPFFLRWTDL